jgi:hypothetical protein
MNWYNDVPGRMECIQKLFLEVGNKISAITAVGELLDLLDAEPPEFRSVAYEGASFEIALKDLKEHSLDQWIEFREACGTKHTFHIDIGLGWAFAKAGVFPDSLLSSMQQAVKWMVFDGIGYYYALFKGRTTLKAKIIPPEINGESLNSFDQGVGRRLWYMARGNTNEVNALVAGFPEGRHPDLFRGIGIACGYVGGNKENDLKDLLEISGSCHKQLQTGIVLAAISRIASNSVNEDIDRACRIICNKSVIESTSLINKAASNFFYLYNTGTGSYWLTQLESELLQTD